MFGSINFMFGSINFLDLELLKYSFEYHIPNNNMSEPSTELSFKQAIEHLLIPSRTGERMIDVHVLVIF